MFVPRETIERELIVRGSRFIAAASFVSTANDALALIRSRRLEHPHASHVVYAWRIGPPRSEALGQSDDGEPKGTAGRPVLEVLKGSDLTNCLLTVVRYFGGTKLGTGGLVRAYGEAAKLIVSTVERVPLDRRLFVRCIVDYARHPAVRLAMERAGVTEICERFGADVALNGRTAPERIASAQEAVRNVSRGTIELQEFTPDQDGLS